jgi:hypothetical protein
MLSQRHNPVSLPYIIIFGSSPILFAGWVNGQQGEDTSKK